MDNKDECIAVRTLLMKYNKNELPFETLELVEEHMKTCDECRKLQSDIVKNDQGDSEKTALEADFMPVLKKLRHKFIWRRLTCMIILLIIPFLYVTTMLIGPVMKIDGDAVVMPLESYYIKNTEEKSGRLKYIWTDDPLKDYSGDEWSVSIVNWYVDSDDNSKIDNSFIRYLKNSPIYDSSRTIYEDAAGYSLIKIPVRIFNYSPSPIYISENVQMKECSDQAKERIYRINGDGDIEPIKLKPFSSYNYTVEMIVYTGNLDENEIESMLKSISLKISGLDQIFVARFCTNRSGKLKLKNVDFTKANTSIYD